MELGVVYLLKQWYVGREFVDPGLDAVVQDEDKVLNHGLSSSIAKVVV